MNGLLAIGMPGPFELLILGGMLAVVVLVVWLLTRGR